MYDYSHKRVEEIARKQEIVDRARAASSSGNYQAAADKLRAVTPSREQA